MNRQEVGQFLALAALVDNRAVTAEAALMWAELLGDVPYDAAVAAMQAHYRESSDWLMPVHIVQRVRSARLAIGPSTMSPEAPEACAGGRHRRMPDGTCMFCTDREPPDA